MLRDVAKDVVTILQDEGFQAVFAGGCVRDEILGVEPHDYDVATSATPDQVKNLFDRVILVGESFGVVRVVFGDDVVEVATFRKDGVYDDGRHPSSVEFSDMESDALRRDFTMNAMFKDPVSGDVFNFVGGLEDLKSRTLRFVGDAEARISEDPLRMLRAVRFSSRFGMSLDACKDAILRNSPKILSVSGERVYDEVTRMIMGPRPGRSVSLLAELGLLEHILPEVFRLRYVEQPVEFHPEGSALAHTVDCLHSLRKNTSEVLAWAILLHDVGKFDTMKFDDRKGRLTFIDHASVGADLLGAEGGVYSRLRFPGRVFVPVGWLVRNHMRMIDFFKMSDVKQARLMQPEFFGTLVDLFRADSMGAGREDPSREVLDFVDQAPSRFWEKKSVVSGDDLICLGMTPGPTFSWILEKVLDAQIMGRVHDRDSGLRYAGHLFRSLAGSGQKDFS